MVRDIADLEIKLENSNQNWKLITFIAHFGNICITVHFEYGTFFILISWESLNNCFCG